MDQHLRLGEAHIAGHRAEQHEPAHGLAVGVRQQRRSRIGIRGSTETLQPTRWSCRDGRIERPSASAQDGTAFGIDHNHAATDLPDPGQRYQFTFGVIRGDCQRPKSGVAVVRAGFRGTFVPPLSNFMGSLREFAGMAAAMPTVAFRAVPKSSIPTKSGRIIVPPCRMPLAGTFVAKLGRCGNGTWTPCHKKFNSASDAGLVRNPTQQERIVCIRCLT